MKKEKKIIFEFLFSNLHESNVAGLGLELATRELQSAALPAALQGPACTPDPAH